MDGEGMEHMAWMVCSLTYISFTTTQRFFSSLYIGTPMESAICSMCLSFFLYFVFAFHRQCQRRTIDEEAALEKQRMVEHQMKREARLKQTQKDEVQDGKGKKKKGKGKKAKSLTSSTSSNQEADGFEAQRQAILDRLSKSSALSSIVGSFNMYDLVEQLGNPELLDRVKEAEEKEDSQMEMNAEQSKKQSKKQKNKAKKQ